MSRMKLLVALVAAAIIAAATSCAGGSSKTNGSGGLSASTTHVEPSGNWQAVGSGTTAETSWTLYSTSGSNNGLCVSVDFSPSFADNPGGVVQFSTYQGRPAVCGFTPGTALWHGAIAPLFGVRGNAMKFAFLLGLGEQGTRGFSAVGDGGQVSSVVTTETSPPIFLFVAPNSAALDRVFFEADGVQSSCSIRWREIPTLDTCA